MTRLSILIPAFNEDRTLATLLNRVLAADTAGVEKELIVVDNASSDNTPAVLTAMRRLQPQLKILTSKRNLGKGDAIRRALAEATGDWVLLQDADLEYDPADYLGLLAPALRGEATVVYGSRHLHRMKGARPGHRLFYWGNRFLTWCTNWLYGATLSDMCTCYKLLPADLMRQLSLTSDGFGVDAEVTAKLLRRRIPIREVPISYAPRTRSEGKKINSLDGLVALWTLLRSRWDRY